MAAPLGSEADPAMDPVGSAAQSEVQNNNHKKTSPVRIANTSLYEILIKFERDVRKLSRFLEKFPGTVYSETHGTLPSGPARF
jgi:hypothetical protein